MPITRPSQFPDWCLTGTRTPPGVSATNTGFAPDFAPPAEWHNFLFGVGGDWIRYLDQQAQLNKAKLEFDAVVGTNGDYPTINALIADIIANSLVIKKVLVTTTQTLTATQVIPSTMTDMEFVFRPDATYVKGLTTTPGLSIAGQRITIRGGRWTSFNGVSDSAIQLEAASRNCRVIDINFNDNTTAVNDLAGASGNHLIANCIEEV